MVSVYIGIPFAPAFVVLISQCNLNDYSVQVKPFLTCLWQEMIAGGVAEKKKFVGPVHIYWWWNPTVLTLEDQQNWLKFFMTGIYLKQQ